MWMPQRIDVLLSEHLWLLRFVIQTVSNINPVACYQYASPAGNTYTKSGLYEDTLVNAAGCDSIIHINLSIRSALAFVTQNGHKLTANNSTAYQWVDCDNDYQPIAGAASQRF